MMERARNLDEHDLKELKKRIGKLRSPLPAERARAQQIILDSGPEAISMVVTYLQREARNIRKIRVGMLAVMLLCAAAIIPAKLIGLPQVAVWCGILSFSLLGGFGGLVMGTSFYKTAIETLKRADDVRAIGALVEALEFMDMDTQSAACEALARLLPRLQATDATLLNPNQRKRLYRFLGKSDKRLILALLKALEQIGDSNALPYVERLATSKKVDTRIREAAQSCMPYLQFRQEEEHNIQTLLRAASTGATAETLLRSANETPETDPMHLLRVPAGNGEV